MLSKALWESIVLGGGSILSSGSLDSSHYQEDKGMGSGQGHQCLRLIG